MRRFAPTVLSGILVSGLLVSQASFAPNGAEAAEPRLADLRETLSGLRRESLGAAESSPMGTPTENLPPIFDDVDDSSFARDILWAAFARITVGCSPTSFCPTAAVTREQMASFLVRTFRYPATSGDYFTDDEASSHEANINALAAAGVTTGCGADTFCPRRTVSRAEMATFLVRALGLQSGAATDAFTDDETSTHETSINRLAFAGVTTGCGVARFCPESSVTRGQMVAFLHRSVTTAPSCLGREATIKGTDAAEQLFGTSGDDVIIGRGGDDDIIGDGGNDRICGGEGSDFVIPGPGSDRVDGGDGTFDLVLFGAASPVQVNLATGIATGEGSDVLVNLEGAVGSTKADVLIGSTRDEVFFPDAGNDLVDGSGGSDIVAFLFGPITATLASAVGEGSDSFSRIEGLAGSDEDDILSGGSGADWLFGFAGNDTLNGGAGDDELIAGAGIDELSGNAGNDLLAPGAGTDELDGGDGTDVAAYFDSTSGVTVNLAAGTATGDGPDTLSSIEGVAGSPFGDVVTGNDGPNHVDGDAGNDALAGGAGNDYLDGSVGTDSANGGLGADLCIAEAVSSCNETTATAGVPNVPPADPTAHVAHLPPLGDRSATGATGYPTHQDMRNLVKHSTYSPTCWGTSTDIYPPGEVGPLFANVEAFYYWPILYWYNFGAARWEAYYGPHTYARVLSGAGDGLGLTYTYGGMATNWIRYGPNASGAAGEHAALQSGYVWQWQVHVWWVGPGYVYSTSFVPAHAVPVTGGVEFRNWCDRR